MPLDPVQQKAAEAVLNEVLKMLSRSVVRGIVQGKWPQDWDPPRADNIMYAVVREGVKSIADQKLRRSRGAQDYGGDGR